MADPTWDGALLAGAAVFAAAVAAWTANHRIAKQLDAESERLGQQLRHDREMRDLEELRGLLDEVAITMQRMISVHNKLEWVDMPKGVELSQPEFLAAVDEIRKEGA